MKFVIWGLALLAGAGMLMWFFGPREPVVTDVTFDDVNLDAGVQAWFDSREARFDDITPGTAKQVVWAGDPEARTDWAVVYLHGFSATSEEVRPLPDLVAEALGANLVFTRLQGHGRSGAAMTEASVEGWMGDVAEALAAARRVGEKVLVMGTSTGATLASLAFHEDMSRGVTAAVFVSPNFRVKSAAAGLLTWPGARWWLPLVAGKDREFAPSNEDHATYWTNAYPTIALLPMGATVKAAGALPHEEAETPALFVFDDLDQVVDHAATRKVAARWGAQADILAIDVGPQDDAGRHVIAGRVMSPGQTTPIAAKIVDWVKGVE